MGQWEQAEWARESRQIGEQCRLGGAGGLDQDHGDVAGAGNWDRSRELGQKQGTGPGAGSSAMSRTLFWEQGTVPGVGIWARSRYLGQEQGSVPRSRDLGLGAENEARSRELGQEHGIGQRTVN